MPKIIVASGPVIVENNKVFILAVDNDYKYGIKIKGTAEYYSSGDCFDFVKSLSSNKDYNPKGAIVVKIIEISEFE